MTQQVPDEKPGTVVPPKKTAKKKAVKKKAAKKKPASSIDKELGKLTGKTAKKKAAPKKDPAKKKAAKRPALEPLKLNKHDFFDVRDNIQALSTSLSQLDPEKHPKVCMLLEGAITQQVHVITNLTDKFYPLNECNTKTLAKAIAALPQQAPLHPPLDLRGIDMGGTTAPIPLPPGAPVPIQGGQ